MSLHNQEVEFLNNQWIERQEKHFNNVSLVYSNTMLKKGCHYTCFIATLTIKQMILL